MKSLRLQFPRLTGTLAFLAMAAGSLSCIPAHAQPDTNTPPVGQNPPNWGNPANMTPAQRQELQQAMQKQMQQLMEQGIRNMLNQAGYTAADLQNIIIEQSRANNEAGTALTEKSMKILEAVRNKADDEQVKVLMAELRAAVKVETERRQKAAQELDARIEYSKKPRLQALLAFLGIADQESSVPGGDMGAILGRLMMAGGMGFGGGAAPRNPGPPPAQ